MSRGYALAYRMGLTPWEAAGEAGREQLTALFDREEAGRQPPYGKALDLGCGYGNHTLELARRGWQATGVDAVPQAVSGAQERARKAGVDVDFRLGDVTALSPVELGSDVELFFDLGCFHGLKDAERTAMGASITRVAAPGATLLMFAFKPGRRGPIPRGTDRQGIEKAFSGWDVVDQTDAETAGMPGPLKKAAPQWYRLRRG